MGRSDSIRISPKFGVNPALTKCFWCGKDTGVALLGRITGGKRGGDLEAPRYVFGGYEPCDECKEKMGMGVLMMEADSEPVSDGQPEMQNGVWPTGRWVVLKKEAAERILNCTSDKAFCDRQTFELLTHPKD